MNAFTALLFCLGLSATCRGAEDAEQPPAGKDLLKSAGIEIDTKKHEVRVEATICLERGILEYMACKPGTFEHEAIFSIKCPPSILHLSLLAIGLEACAFDDPAGWEEKANKESKAQVNILIEYEKDEKKIQVNLGELIKSRKENNAKKPEVWVFTGSYMGERNGKKIYAADVMGGIIGVGLDGGSVIQLGRLPGNPYREEERGLEINSEKVPPQGTTVKLIFTPATNAEAPAAAPAPAPAAIHNLKEK